MKRSLEVRPVICDVLHLRQLATNLAVPSEALVTSRKLSHPLVMYMTNIVKIDQEPCSMIFGRLQRLQCTTHCAKDVQSLRTSSRLTMPLSL